MAQRVVRGAGGKPQVRKGSRDKSGWCVASRDLFLANLSASCNVAASCRKAKLSDTLVYDKRKNDAGFRAQWAAALAEAVERLEMMMLERMMKGKVVEKTRRGGETVKTVEYPDNIALALIRAHKDAAVAADEDEDEATLAALRAKISRKLDIVARREAAKEKAMAQESAGAKEETGGDGEADPAAPTSAASGPVEETPRAGKKAATRDANGRFVRREAGHNVSGPHVSARDVSARDVSARDVSARDRGGEDAS